MRIELSYDERTAVPLRAGRGEAEAADAVDRFVEASGADRDWARDLVRAGDELTAAGTVALLLVEPGPRVAGILALSGIEAPVDIDELAEFLTSEDPSHLPVAMSLHAPGLGPGVTTAVRHGGSATASRRWVFPGDGCLVFGKCLAFDPAHLGILDPLAHAAIAGATVAGFRPADDALAVVEDLVAAFQPEGEEWPEDLSSGAVGGDGGAPLDELKRQLGTP